MEVRTWEFPSSSGGKPYTTRLAADGLLTCSCKGWTIKRPGSPRECKHMKKLITDNGWSRIVLGDLINVSGELMHEPEAVPVHVPLADPLADPMSAPAPMLASAMTTRLEGAAFDAKYATPGWVMEVKLDGHRRMVVKRGAVIVSWSRPRAGSGPATPATLPMNILSAFAMMPDGIYDGELCAAIGAGAKSWDASRVDLPKVFVAFDVLECMGTNVMQEPYSKRRAYLTLAVNHTQGSDSVVCAGQLPLCWTSVEAVWAQGGEGAILKRVDSVYEPGSRSAAWVKVKNLEQHVLTIVGFKAGSYGPHATIIAEFADGVRTTMKTKNNLWLAMFAKDPASFIGKKVTIQCQLRTKDGSPRHPMAIDLELDHMTGGSE